MHCPRCDKKINKPPCPDCNHPDWPNTSTGDVIRTLEKMLIFHNTVENAILSIEDIKEMKNMLTKEYVTWKPPIPHNQCKIFGSEIEFTEMVNQKHILERCREIWDNPEKYCGYKKGSDMSYHGFLKFLWVEFPNGTKKQLGKIILNGL